MRLALATFWGHKDRTRSHPVWSSGTNGALTWAQCRRGRGAPRHGLSVFIPSLPLPQPLCSSTPEMLVASPTSPGMFLLFSSASAQPSASLHAWSSFTWPPPAYPSRLPQLLRPSVGILTLLFWAPTIPWASSGMTLAQHILISCSMSVPSCCRDLGRSLHSPAAGDVAVDAVGPKCNACNRKRAGSACFLSIESR